MIDSNYFHEYYLAHREKIIEYAKMRSKEKREIINANERRRYRRDAEYRLKRVEKSARYRARKAAEK